jgi:hypothetical protein
MERKIAVPAAISPSRMHLFVTIKNSLNRSAYQAGSAESIDVGDGAPNRQLTFFSLTLVFSAY